MEPQYYYAERLHLEQNRIVYLSTRKKPVLDYSETGFLFKLITILICLDHLDQQKVQVFHQLHVRQF